MSNEVQNEDVVEDQLQDEIVDEQEESLEEAKHKKTDEMAASSEVDGEKAAADDAKAAKASAPAKAAEPKAGQGKPMTKMAMVNAMFTKMNGMKKDEMSKMYSSYHPEGVEVEGEAMVENSFDQDLDALVQTEATLSDGFRAKAEVIFEAAVNAKVTDHVNKLDEQFKEELAEETKRIHDEVVDKVDGYLNYVVEKWMEDNKIAVQTGLRTEIAEKFMVSLKDLFTESYIEVPESKVDLVDELAGQVEELEAASNDAITKQMEMQEELEELKRQKVIAEASEGLAATQVEKLKKLAEDVDFESEETFAEKVNTIKESYFTKKTTESADIEEAVEDGDTSLEVTSDTMAQYLSAIQKTNK